MSMVDAEPVFPPGDSARKSKLLIVDDQPANIQVLYRAFVADYQVFMATNGAQALVVCRNQMPDLVLLDVVMDGADSMDGYEICRQMKADPGMGHIPVIFLTAHDDAVQKAKGLAIGAVDFISKPVNPDVVKASVKLALLHKASRPDGGLA